MSRTPGHARGQGPGERVKTLAIRLDEDLHAQLSVIALLGGTTITDEIRLAIEGHVAARRSDAELSARADAALNEIERDAKARQQAIADLFGPAAGANAPASPTGRKGPRSGSSEPSNG